MCGISGIFSEVVSNHQLIDSLKSMNINQIHRGPDSEGEYYDLNSSFGMAMRRLSIVDIKFGIQPLASKDKRYHLVFNGEIINSTEIRKELEKLGIKFFTNNSDTEVLLNFLITKGFDNLNELNGMFCFALYDSLKKKIYLARDRFGIKPLYYYFDNKNFYFSSELKTLLFLDNIKKDINNESINHYLSLMYVPGEDSIFKNIKRLKQGCKIEFDIKNKNLKLEKWHEPSIGSSDLFKDDFSLDSLKKKIVNSVLKWSQSDVDLCCSLSGGLDSSAIVGILSSNGIKVNTFSLGFSGSGYSQLNELELARTVAKKWNSNHEEIVMDEKDLISDLSSMVYSLDEPYGGGLPSWLVYKNVSKKFKVIFTGTGVDEYFGNYGKWSLLKKFGRCGLDKVKFFFDKLYFERNCYFSENEKKKYLNFNLEKNKSTSFFFFNQYINKSSTSVIDKTFWLDMENQLPDEFLLMTDRFSMHHSVEARPSFLENDLFNFISKIPSTIRTSNTDLKYLFREAIKDFLPNEVLYAPKRGFVLPLEFWIKNHFKDMFYYYFSPSLLSQQGIFDKKIFIDFIEPTINKNKNYIFTNKHYVKLWGLLMFQLWYFTFKEKKNYCSTL